MCILGCLYCICYTLIENQHFHIIFREKNRDCERLFFSGAWYIFLTFACNKHCGTSASSRLRKTVKAIVKSNFHNYTEKDLVTDLHFPLTLASGLHEWQVKI